MCQTDSYWTRVADADPHKCNRGAAPAEVNPGALRLEMESLTTSAVEEVHHGRSQQHLFPGGGLNFPSPAVLRVLRAGISVDIVT
ncbi:unnamed protein product [Merluccius merluccius]